jgi:hypothetical protein
LTPEERREYKIKADEMDRKTKEGYDKAKKQDLTKVEQYTQCQMVQNGRC